MAEFYLCFRYVFYFINIILVYLIIIPSVSYNVVNLCNSDWYCKQLIHKTWLNYSIDLADNQWREFRKSLFLFFIAMIIISFFNYILHTLTYKMKYKITYKSIFHLFCSFIILIIMHKWHTIIIISLSIIGYFISYYTRGNTVAPVVTWCYAIFIIFFKESYRLKIPVE